LLRENTDGHGLVQVARKVAETLARENIPHLIAGGLAVQEHGYPRPTPDVDVIVPDVLEAAELLTTLFAGRFQRALGTPDRLLDTRFHIAVDLLPAGAVLRNGCQVPFPKPTEISEEPRIVSLPDLISLKLDRYRVGLPGAGQDLADVIELIRRRNLPRGFPVASPVRKVYRATWDGV
jgi:hypothetical protein